MGSPEWNCEGVRVGKPDGIFFITESNSEVIKEGPLLGLKDTMIDGDVIWGIFVYPEWKCEGIRLDNPDGNSKIFTVGTSGG